MPQIQPPNYETQMHQQHIAENATTALRQPKPNTNGNKHKEKHEKCKKHATIITQQCKRTRIQTQKEKDTLNCAGAFPLSDKPVREKKCDAKTGVRTKPVTIRNVPQNPHNLNDHNHGGENQIALHTAQPGCRKTPRFRNCVVRLPGPCARTHTNEKR